MILIVSQLLSQEQDFRRRGGLGAGDDVHELQSIPNNSQTTITTEGRSRLQAMKWQHGSSAAHRVDLRACTPLSGHLLSGPLGTVVDVPLDH